VSHTRRGGDHTSRKREIQVSKRKGFSDLIAREKGATATHVTPKKRVKKKTDYEIRG